MEFACFQLIKKLFLYFFLSAARNFEILGFFRFSFLKTQKVHCLTSGILVYVIGYFQLNNKLSLNFVLSAAGNFEILRFFRFRRPKNTKGEWFDFWYPYA